MHELAKVTLENELDLILAHKRSMKLGEIAGLSLSAQTTFATAVSEVARNTIESGKSGCLLLGVESDQRDKYIVASVRDEQPNGKHREGLDYAKRLVNKYQVTSHGAETNIELFYSITPIFRIDIQKIDEWRSLFRNEPPISPYEELKRKNQQLQELSDKFQKSEAQYKILTNALPLAIFALDNEGKLLYSNDWLLKYTGANADTINRNSWESVVHQEDYPAFSLLLRQVNKTGIATMQTQARIRNRQLEDYFWHQVSLTPFRTELADTQYWIGYIVDIHAQKVVEHALKENIELIETQGKLREYQQTLEQYNTELARSNEELQQFAYVASHDLQEPVRKMLFYSDYLVNHYEGAADSRTINYLTTIRSASVRMRSLIQDVLAFSLINRAEMKFSRVDLDKVAAEALHDLEIIIGEKNAAITCSNLPEVYGDPRMIRQLFDNLLGNALKYSKEEVRPEIQILGRYSGDNVEISFKDNGIGFDQQFLGQIFSLFQRLHNREKYNGTGLGLAICRKITDLHGGKIWAEGQEQKGATFFVSLPNRSTIESN
jgi:PAS domain S-box-containing protein